MDDGQFEVVLAHTPRSLADLNQLVGEVMRNGEDGTLLSIRQARRVRFRFDEPVPWTRDGESGGACTDVTLENCARAVRFLV